MQKIEFNEIPDNVIRVCDYCRKRKAIYYSRKDNTLLCEHCIDRYLKEHHIKVYQVRLC